MILVSYAFRVNVRVFHIITPSYFDFINTFIAQFLNKSKYFYLKTA
ncbi:hypothetical protein BSPA14S_I0023 (plasmid) [Borreliella spielmanii A14S]|uniref:Uncharacterized protein n=1 Tax=Borreliella spielmanii A14S TaxID=498742 RepID=C0RCA2_9SPIR|nr:hypothetical protein BSPA14S_I0023 [Borreliella spielmanii A14S]